MTLRSEVLAFAFGALVIFVTFGDNHLSIEDRTITVGNLDTIFGLAVWPVLDVVYFAGSIAIFLLYGWTKGGGRLRFNLANVLVFASFLVVLTLISIDDVATLLHLPLNPPTVYWNVVSWVYPICSFLSFILFNKHAQP
jgi:hypothetical protein